MKKSLVRACATICNRRLIVWIFISVLVVEFFNPFIIPVKGLEELNITFISIGEDGSLNQNFPSIILSIKDSNNNHVSDVSISLDNPDYSAAYWQWTYVENGENYVITALSFPGLALKDDFIFSFVKVGYNSQVITRELAINSAYIEIIDEFGNLNIEYNKRFNFASFPSHLTVINQFQTIFIDLTKYYVAPAYFEGNYSCFVVLDANLNLVTDEETYNNSILTAHMGKYFSECFSPETLAELSAYANTIVLAEYGAEALLFIRDNLAKIAGTLIGKHFNLNLIPNKADFSQKIIEDLTYQNSWLDYMKANVLWWIAGDPPYPSYFEFTTTMTLALLKGTAITRLQWAGELFLELKDIITLYQGETYFEFNEIDLMYQKWVTASLNVLTSIDILLSTHPSAELKDQLFNLTLTIASEATNIPFDTLLLDCPTIGEILTNCISKHRKIEKEFMSWLIKWQIASLNLQSAIINLGTLNMIETFSIENDFKVIARVQASGDYPSSNVVLEGSTAFTVRVEKETGSPGQVTLSCVDKPSTWSVSFSTTSGIPSFTSTMNVQTTSTHGYGCHKIVIAATDGVKTRTCQINVNVVSDDKLHFSMDVIPSPQIHGAWVNWHGYYPDWPNPNIHISARIGYKSDYDHITDYDLYMDYWVDPWGLDQWALIHPAGKFPIYYHAIQAYRDNYNFEYPITSRYRAEYGGTYSNVVVFDVEQAPTTATIEASRINVIQGDEVYISGFIRSDYGVDPGSFWNMKGQWFIDIRPKDGAWTEVFSGEVDSQWRKLGYETLVNGWGIEFNIPEQTWIPNTSGIYEIRSRYSGEYNYKPSISDTILVTVNPNTYSINVAIEGLPSEMSVDIYLDEVKIGEQIGGSEVQYDDLDIESIYSLSAGHNVTLDTENRYISDTLSFVVNGAENYTFAYEKEVLLSTEIYPEYGGNISLTGMSWMPLNFIIEAYSHANSSYVFDHWKLDNVVYDSSENTTFVMDVPHTLTAVFASVNPPESASILLSEKYGAPGELISIEGWNFTETEGLDVDVFLDKDSPILLGTYQTNADGSFSGTFTVPTTVFDDYDITAVSEDNVTASTLFRVGIYIVILVPDNGPEGANVSITGAGFTPYGGWNATFDGIPLVTDGNVDESGIISDYFIVPDITLGFYNVTVCDKELGVCLDTCFEVVEKINPIKLSLQEPEIHNFTVGINGVVLSDESTITELVWNWDDGVNNTQWFPAFNHYQSPGTYNVTATAYDSEGNNKTGWCSVVIGDRVRRVLFDYTNREQFAFWYGYIDLSEELEKEGYLFYQLGKDFWLGGEINSSILSYFDVLVIANSQQSFTEAEIEAVERFVERGGGLFVIASNRAENILQAFDIQYYDPLIYLNDTVTNFELHQITENITELHLINAVALNVTGSAQTIASSDGYPTIAACEYGLGRVVVLSSGHMYSIRTYDADNLLFAKNLFYWLSENLGGPYNDSLPIVQMKYTNIPSEIEVNSTHPVTIITDNYGTNPVNVSIEIPTQIIFNDTGHGIGELFYGGQVDSTINNLSRTHTIVNITAEAVGHLDPISYLYSTVNSSIIVLDGVVFDRLDILPLDFIDPTYGPVGTVVKINGSGFNPYSWIEDGEISIRNGTYIHKCGLVNGPSEVDENGQFDVAIVIPQLPQTGVYKLNITNGEGNEVIYNFTVTGLSRIRLNPSYGPPGTSVLIQGWNFTRIFNTEVQVYLTGNGYNDYIDSFYTSSVGYFEGSYNVPAVPDDVYVINASTSEYYIDCVESFYVNLILVNTSPTSGSTGTNVTLVGTGFTPFGKWNATFNGLPLFVDLDVDEFGNIQDYFLVPDVEPGIYTISVLDVDTEINVNTTFTVLHSPLCLLVRGNNDRIYYNVYVDESWNGWKNLPGATNDRPAEVMIGKDLHVVVRGLTGGLYHSWLDMETEAFSGWFRISGDTPSAPVLATSDGSLFLVVRGNNNRIYYREWDGSWGDWRSVPGATLESPGATVVGDDLHLVVIGTNSRLYHGVVDTTNYSFSGWSGISGSTPSQPVLADDEALVYLVVRGNNDRIYMNKYTGTWSGWTGLPGSTGLSPGAAVCEGDLHLVVKGMTGGLYHGTWDLSSHAFDGWTRLSGDTPSPPTLAAD